MSKQTEELVREAYAAFGRGDVEGYLHACTHDFTFHVPGQGGISGVYLGKEGMYDLAAKAMNISGGTFSEEVRMLWCLRGTGSHGTERRKNIELRMCTT